MSKWRTEMWIKSLEVDDAAGVDDDVDKLYGDLNVYEKLAVVDQFE